MKNNPKNKPKGKIETMRETLALAKSERPVPASAGVNADLAIDEQHIENCLRQGEIIVEDIGKTLAKIHLEKKYPERTFELYIKRRWKHSVQWGYLMIKSYENVKSSLQTSVQNKQVSSQAQALALGKAEPEKRAEILDEVAKEGKVTAKKIEAKIAEKEKPKEAEFRIVVKDANGDEVPEEIAKDFINSQEETRHIRSLLNEVRRWLENEEPFKVEISRTAAIEGVRDVLGMAAVGSGEFLCPYCKGKKCKVCHKRGFVSKTFYTQSIPDDKK